MSTITSNTNIFFERVEAPKDAMLMYRYEDGSEFFGSSFINLVKLFVLRETSSGYWLTDEWGYDIKKWVSKCGRKRYCYPTKQEALDSYVARKCRHVKILKSQLALAEMRYADTDKIQKELDNEHVINDLQSHGQDSVLS